MSLPVPNPGWRPASNAGAQSLPVNSPWSAFYYAGVNFGPFTHITDYNVEVVYDARMNRSYNVFVLTCESTITWDAGVNNGPNSYSAADALATRVRQALTTQAAPLLLKGRAVGVMAVNNGVVTDIKNGPIPRMMGPEVLGELTSKFVWTLTWHLPDCPDAVYSAALGTLSNTYTVSTVVEKGYTTRIIAGKAVIPQNRLALGARLPANAATKFQRALDGQPGSLFPLEPYGFFRGPYSCTLNEDRSELSYSITDTQMGLQAPPPGCITADESYDLGTQQRAGLARWSATLQGRYEIPYNAPSVNDAVDAFFEFAGGKLFFLKTMLAQQRDANGNPVQGVPNGLIPTAFSVSEPEVRGRRIVALSLSVEFTTGLRNVIEQSGVWRRVSNGDWQAWYDSMGWVFNPLGTAALDFDVTKDTIVDLCQPNVHNLGNNAPTTGDLRRYALLPIPEPKPEDRNLVAQLLPVPGQDWLSYYCNVFPEDDDGTNGVVTLSTEPLAGSTDLVGQFNAMVASAVKAVISSSVGSGVAQLIGGQLLGPLTPPTPQPPGQGGAGANAAGVVPPGVPTDSSVGIPDNLPTGTTWVERRVRPFRYVWFIGAAERYGSPVPEPGFNFAVIAGKKYPLVRCQRPEDGPAFWQRSLLTANVFGGNPKPRYQGFWRMRFGFVGPIKGGNVETPPNPYTGN
jgi:hypothetical protein